MLLSRSEARDRLLSWLGLCQPLGVGVPGARATLERLRCIQLDPLDCIGTNADLVARARVDGLPRGAIYSALLPGHAFEHFAKERCLVPAARFVAYRARALQAPWWRLSERLQRVDAALIAEVLAEVQARGPLTVEELTHRGRVEPLDWSGWTGTASATRMAIEILWTRCEVVVCGREGRRKRYDLPERALGPLPAVPDPAQAEALLLHDRVAAAGLLPTRLGPWWSGLRTIRESDRIQEMVDQRALVRLRVEGSPRAFLASPAFLEAPLQEADDRLRLLGPLDPLLWDRDLVRQVFGFDYTWEVYTPPEKRRFGWYVVPLLHHGHLVGRMEGKTDPDGQIQIVSLWEERPGSVDRRALDAALNPA